jgi:hypothetical protein
MICSKNLMLLCWLLLTFWKKNIICLCQLQNPSWILSSKFRFMKPFWTSFCVCLFFWVNIILASVLCFELKTLKLFQEIWQIKKKLNQNFEFLHKFSFDRKQTENECKKYERIKQVSFKLGRNWKINSC